jgi:S-adenosylmethionine/arginine decarboxylase-like enzyme
VKEKFLTLRNKINFIMEIKGIKWMEASLYKCQIDLHNFDINVKELESILNKAATSIGAKPVKIDSHVYEDEKNKNEKCGATSCAIIKDPSGFKASAITISTYPEINFASLNIESCIPSSNLYDGLSVFCNFLRPGIVIGIYGESSFSPEIPPKYEEFQFVNGLLVYKKELFSQILRF